MTVYLAPTFDARSEMAAIMESIRVGTARVIEMETHISYFPWVPLRDPQHAGFYLLQSCCDVCCGSSAERSACWEDFT